MKLNDVLLSLGALAGFACASDSHATPRAERSAEAATEAAAAKLPEVRYYVIADT